MNQRMVFFVGFPLLWVVLWGLVAVVSVGLRPPLPGTELHTLAMAWDMWQRDAFLVPGLAGNQPDTVYPLYLWLIHGTWALFGISDTWPRLLPPVLGLGCTVMIAALCRAIWPGWAGLGALAGTMAMGMAGWLVFATISGADLLFTLCILVALWGLIIGWRRGTWDGFVLLGFGIGLGFLVNGLSILVHVLPVALLTPVWAPALGWATTGAAKQGTEYAGSSGWRQWYVRLGISLLIGIIMIAAWIVPAVMASGSGEEMAAIALLVSGFMFGSTVFMTSGVGAGGQQWWLYLLALGFFLLPWIVWPAAWRAIGGLWPLLKDGGGRFCLIWLLPSVIVYALLPGARPFDVALHVPPLAMIAAYLLYLRVDAEMARQEAERRFGNGEAVLGMLIALIGMALIVVPLSGGLMVLPWWIEGISGAWGLVLVGVAAIAAYGAPRMVFFRATLVTIQMALVVLIGMLAASPLLMAQANIGPAADHLRHALDQDTAVAFVGTSPSYGHAMDFPARLEQPLAILDPEDSIGVVAWAAGHEGGQIAVVMDQLLMGGKPVAIFPYMGQYLVFWATEIIAEHPGIVVGPMP